VGGAFGDVEVAAVVSETEYNLFHAHRKADFQVVSPSVGEAVKQILVQQKDADGILADKQQCAPVQHRAMPRLAPVQDDGKQKDGGAAAEGIEKVGGERVVGLVGHGVEHHRVAFQQYATGQQPDCKDKGERE